MPVFESIQTTLVDSLNCDTNQEEKLAPQFHTLHTIYSADNEDDINSQQQEFNGPSHLHFRETLYDIAEQ